MKKVGIIVKKGVPRASGILKDTLQWLDRKHAKVFVEKEVASTFKLKGYTKEEIASKSDIILVFGGDGTLLSAVRQVGKRGTPILGVNLGSLGFITEISLDEMNENIVDRIFSGKYRFEERIILLSDVYRKGRRVVQQTALNDVVISKSALSRMVEFDVHINKQYVTAFRADGLIVSTPTGSTAHSLSAGGPILYPTLESFVMTPICPHTLTNRPLVLPDKFSLEVSIKKGKDVYLTLDGQVGCPLKPGDKIIVKKAKFKARLLLIHERDFFQVLRKKLRWGEG